MVIAALLGALLMVSMPSMAGHSTAKAGKKLAWVPVGMCGGGSMYTTGISPHDPQVIMLNCDMSCAFMTHDGGENWQMIHHRELRANTRCRPVFHPTNPKVVYAASDWGGKLKISKDLGVHWQELGDLPRGVVELYIDPGHPRLMLAGSNEDAYLSRDAGRHWTKVPDIKGRVVGFHIDQTSPKTNRVCFAGTTSGIFRSRDGGTTWTRGQKGLPQDLFSEKTGRLRGTPSFAGGSNGHSGECILYVVLPSRLKRGKLDGGVYRSLDRGDTWQRVMRKGINQETRAADEWSDGDIAQYRFVLTTNVRPRTVYVAGSSTGYMPPHFATIYRSDDAGGAWRPIFYSDPRYKKFNADHDYLSAKIGQSYNSVPFGLSIGPGDPDVLVYTNSMQCYITHNGGKHWMAAHARRAGKEGQPSKNEPWRCNGLVVTTTWEYEIDPFEPNRHYICYTDIGFARSLDHGATWIWGSWSGFPWRNTLYQMAFDPEVPGKMWGAFANVHDIPNANIILGRHGDRGPGGICVSENFGVRWQVSNQGLPEQPALSIVLDPKSPQASRTLYAAVFSQGVYKSTDGGKEWKKTSRGLGAPGVNMRVCRLHLHPDGTLDALVTAKVRNGKFRLEGVGLYRSVDGANTWKNITKSLTLHWPKDFTVDQKDSRIIYVGAADPERPPRGPEGGLYRTVDGGQTWKRIARKGPGHFGAALHPEKGWIYMTLCEGTPDAPLWLSKDDGKTWLPFNNLPFSNIMRMAFDPQDDSIVYATTFGGSVWKGPAEP